MELTNSYQLFEEDYNAREEKIIPFVEKEIVKKYFDHYYETSNPLRGAKIGFFLCLPFWTFIFWFII